MMAGGVKAPCVKVITKMNSKKDTLKYNICMISDFFYPNMGGVENHIYQLSQCLLARGHKIVVVTHSHGSRTGVRYMTCGLKVYYLPFRTFYNGVILPTLYTTLPLFRNIFIREKIHIVHGHSAFSAMSNEGIIHARNMGIKTVFTDHSLFGFADASAVITNKLLQLILTDCNHVICVSHTGKGNTVLRGRVPSDLVSVIPNAIDTSIFKPDPRKCIRDKVTIVVISRLVYRKGVDLLAKIIPPLCSKYSFLIFIIGGDGPKRIILEEIREKYQLHEQVILLGFVNHDSVRDVLVQGNIFLNTSLTEAFCIAIVEAAAAGLQVVCTKVGGVPEVLPSEFIKLCEPTVQDLLATLEKSILDARARRLCDPYLVHEHVRSMYSWQDVALRTEVVYDSIANDIEKPFFVRLKKYTSQRTFDIFGHIFCILVFIDWLLLKIIEVLLPMEILPLIRDDLPRFDFTFVAIFG